MKFMKKRIIICPPTYFDIQYEINPWMKTSQKIDPAGANAAYVALRDTYRSLPVELHEAVPQADLPDMVYAADWGHVEGNLFIPSNFRYAERRREADVAAEFLQTKFGLSIQRLPDGVFFEGHGDLIKTPTRFFIGHGFRSSFAAAAELQKFLANQIFSLHLINPFYYHLDTCFAALGDEAALVNESAFAPESLELIKKLFPKVIFTSGEDNAVMAHNLVTVGNDLICAKGISNSLKKQLEGFGYRLHEIDTVEYRKGGGSVKCMTFEF